jgi:hypothetical protein
MGICGEYDFLDFQISCIRESWSAILPAAFVFVLSFTYIPLPQTVRRGRFLRDLVLAFQKFLGSR